MIAHIVAVMFLGSFCYGQSFDAIVANPSTSVIGGSTVITTTYSSTGTFIYWVGSTELASYTVTGSSGIIDSTPAADTNGEISSGRYLLKCTPNGAASTNLQMSISELTASDNNVQVKFTVSGKEITHNLVVTTCPAMPNANVKTSTGTGCSTTDYNIKDCSTTFQCNSGYTGTEVTATCQNDATWSQSNIVCTPITCNTTLFDDSTCNCSLNTTDTSVAYDESVEVICDDGYAGDPTNATCVGPNDFEYSITCSLLTTVPESTVALTTAEPTTKGSSSTAQPTVNSTTSSSPLSTANVIASTSSVTCNTTVPALPCTNCEIASGTSFNYDQQATVQCSTGYVTNTTSCTCQSTWTNCDLTCSKEEVTTTTTAAPTTATTPSTTTPVGSPDSSSPQTSTTSTEPGGLSPGAIAGIVIGVVVVLGACIGAIVYFKKR